MSHTYPTSLYTTIASIEEDHFWFRARNDMISAFIRRMISGPYATMTFLEIGCGTGIVMAMLERLGFVVTGLDVNAKALSYAATRTKGKLVRQSIFGFAPKKQYDVIGAFDVLEHIRDDRGFLTACKRLLRAKGYIVLTVPAGMRLWSPVDLASGHVRRYEYAELLQKLNEAGFTVKSQVYWNSLLLPLYNVWHQRSGRSGETAVATHLQKMPRVLNTVLLWIFHAERILSRFIRFPFGATIVVCAQKGTKT